MAFLTSLFILRGFFGVDFGVGGGVGSFEDTSRTESSNETADSVGLQQFNTINCPFTISFR